MKITDKNFLEKTKEQAKQYLDELAGGKSAREISAKIYMTLPNKSEEIAEQMADRVIATVKTYNDALDKCIDKQNNIGEYVSDAIKASVKDIDSAAERSKIYYRNIIALKAYSIYAEGGENADVKAREYAEKNGAFPYDDEDASNIEEILFEKNVEAVMNSNIAVVSLPALLDELKDEETDLAVGVFEFGKESADIKTIISMQAYVNAMNGMYRDINANCDIDTVTLSACAAVDTVAAVEQHQAGKITKQILEIVLRIIGYVVGMIIGSWGSIAAIAMLSALIAITASNGLFGCIAFIVLTFAAYGSNLLDRVLDEVGKAGEKVSIGIIKVTKFVVGLLVKGVNAALEIIKPIAAKGIAWFKDVASDVGKLISDTAEAEKNKRAAEADDITEDMEEDIQHNKGTVLA